MSESAMYTPERRALFLAAKSLSLAAVLAAVSVLLVSILEDFCFVFIGWSEPHPVLFIPYVLFVLSFLPILVPIYLWRCLLLLVFCLLVALTTRSTRVAAWMGAFLGIYIATNAVIEKNFFSQTKPFVESIKITLFNKKYQACALSAIDVGNGRKLAVCEKHFYDQGDAVGGTTDEIIYDSSDQITLPQGQRSAEWQKAAGELGLLQSLFEQNTITKRQELVMKDKFGAITPLAGHFYHVTL